MGVVLANSLADEIAAVDAFLAAKKSLAGPPPEFGAKAVKFHRKGGYEQQAIWPIADELGVVTTWSLRICGRPANEFSISLIYNKNPVCRLDMAALSDCESNPLWAAGLPPRVCGPHFHGWELNREFIAKTGVWELKAREPLPPQIRKFDQAFPWLADRLNLVLTAEQRGFEIPAKLV